MVVDTEAGQSEIEVIPGTLTIQGQSGLHGTLLKDLDSPGYCGTYFVDQDGL